MSGDIEQERCRLLVMVILAHGVIRTTFLQSTIRKEKRWRWVLYQSVTCPTAGKNSVRVDS